MKKSEHIYRLRGRYASKGVRLQGYGVIKAGATFDAAAAEKLRRCGYGGLLEQVPAWEVSKAETAVKAPNEPEVEVSEPDGVSVPAEAEEPVKPKKSRKAKKSDAAVEVEGNADASASESGSVESESEATE